MKKIKILHILHSGAIGGGPKMVYSLATHFNSGRFTSIVICTNDGPLKANLEQAGVCVIPMNIAKKYRFLFSVPKMIRVIQRVKPDIVHCHGQYSGLFGSISARLAGSRQILYTARWPSFLADTTFPRKIRNKMAERVTCLCAKVVVCVSNANKKEFLKRRLSAKDKIIAIYNAAFFVNDTDIDKNIVKNNFGLRSHDIVIGSISRLADQKGIKFFIESMPTILAKFPNCRFLIVGDGPEKQNLILLTKNLKIDRYITFTGFRRDISALLAIMNIIIVPSLYEPFGIVATEAMSMGRPVVASNVDGLSEIVIHQKTGFLVPLADPKAIATAIIKLLNHPQMMLTMGSRGKERAQHLFSEERMLSEYNNLYLHLASENNFSRY